ncbi:DUF3786 domain-containing protein [Thermodesulfobacteriota bacterium]
MAVDGFIEIEHMGNNYETIIKDNLLRVFERSPDDLQNFLPAERENDFFLFRAFGEDCSLSPLNVTFSGIPEKGPKGLLISLYALQASSASLQLEPFLSFRDLPDSMPYQGAFVANSEHVLTPHVSAIKDSRELILEKFDGRSGPPDLGGDFSFRLHPLPKIALCYIFYSPDDDFPASATCLFSSNAGDFMPLDGLADVGEYTSKKLIELTCAKR